jgi:hypothetical protein
MAGKRKKIKQAQSGHGHYMLPGVGDGLVDPDFDNIEGAEADLIESVGAHRSDQSEDYN